MQPLNQPADGARAAYLICVGRIRDRQVRDQLVRVAPDIEAAARIFAAAGQTQSFYSLRVHTMVGGTVTKDQMCEVYTARMAKKGMAGRRVYDRIKSIPVNERCPLCGQRTVSTLDHYLPKAYFPSLAVAPDNLVPACADCNKSKGDAIPLTGGSQTLHPYYDDISGEEWLSASVLPSSPPALRFYVNPPAGADPVLAERVRHHFRTFALAGLYASHGAAELSNIQTYMTELLSTAGVAGVTAHLASMSRSCADADRNSWQAAAYRALSNDAWYCAGGFV